MNTVQAGAPSTGSVGSREVRKQDPMLLTGRGRFVDDIQERGMLHCAVLRSPHAHARIKSIDATRAEAIPGVVAVVAGPEVAELSEPLPPTIDIEMKLTRCHAIAIDRVRYQGEAVAAVAATDRYVAEDALEAIAVEYEVLPAVVDIDDSLSESAPQLYEEWGDNAPLRWALQAGDAEAAFAASDVVVEERFSHHRYLAAALETRGAVAAYDPMTGQLDVTASTQVPQQARTMLAETLRLPEHKIRVTVGQVGGGFGSKTTIDAEVIPCLLALKTGRPVKWIETRSENLATSAHSRDYRWQIKGGFTAEAKITAIQAHLIADVGCDGTNRASGVAPPLLAIYYLPGSYHVPVYDVTLTCVATNKAAAGALRGYGKDVATDGIERFLDLAARRLELAPNELRRRNLIQPDEYPYTQVTGPVYDSGDVPQLLAMAQEALGIDEFRARQSAAQAEGRYLGIGFACMTEPSGGAVPNCIYNGYEPATVRVTPEGGVLLVTGLIDIGQGTETTLAQVVADELSLTSEDVRVVAGDTDAMPYGLGSWSSRGASYGVSAAVLAARQVRAKVLRVGANLLASAEEDVELHAGGVRVKGVPDRALTLRDVARAVYLWPGPHGVVPEGDDPGLEATAVWSAPNTRWVPDEIGTLSLYATHPTGCFGAIVEVDVETGKVLVERFVVAHDCGNLINPSIVEGQISGGAVTGIAGALLEEIQYDGEGNLLTRGYRDYLVPTAADVPPIEVCHLVSPSPFTPLGTKGMGEGGAIGSAPAVVNAVQDALAPFGITIRDLPIRPDRLVSLLHDATQQATPSGPTPGGGPTKERSMSNASPRLPDLRASGLSFQGRLLRPDDDGYDDARAVFSSMIDRRPALVAQCEGTADVASALEYARENDLRVVVRSGGHSVSGASMCDDGVVIDLRRMNTVRVDEANRTAQVGGGCTWGHVDRATEPLNLATTGGRVSTTGVGGFTLGGGSGWLERAHGLACDNLISAQVVTAAGEVVRATAEEHPDLLWALRGGGGNFGVVTEFELQLHEVATPLLGGLLVFEAERGNEAAAGLRDLMAAAPDELGAALAYLTAPDDPGLPAHMRGQLVTGTVICWNGDPEEGAELIAPLRALNPPVDHVGPVTYADLQCSIDNPPGYRGYWTAEYLRELGDDAIAVFHEHAQQMLPGQSQALLVPWGGAVARVAEGATPLAQRDAAWVMHPFGSWESAEDDERGIAWTRGFRAAMQPFATGGVYLNFVGEEGDDRIRSAFGEANYDRLAEIKHQYDPDNVFRGNQNIRPLVA